MITPIHETTEQNTQNASKKKALIFDIDGVVCDSSERFKRIDLYAFGQLDRAKFVESIKSYNQDCEGDLVLESGKKLLHSLLNGFEVDKVFFITARGDGGFGPTLKWLEENMDLKTHMFELWMQPEDLSNIDAYEFSTEQDHARQKMKMAEEIMKSYDVVCAVDDSAYNVWAYFNLGIPSLRFLAPNLGRVLI